MSADPVLTRALDPEAALEGDGLKACCAEIYAHPAVRWLLGGELHPGGAETTRWALQLIGLGRGDRLLDVACGDGASALLAARELGCEVVGIDYGEQAVRDGSATAEAEGLGDRVSFVRADAESLPVSDRGFDAVLCECSLCVFPDKRTAVAEMRRALRPGGRLAIADVVVDRERLPAELLGGAATIACVGDALDAQGYRELLADAGFELIAERSCDGEADGLAERVEERLRGARLLGMSDLGLSIEQAIEQVRRGRAAIAEGSLGYAIFAASL